MKLHCVKISVVCFKMIKTGLSLYQGRHDSNVVDYLHIECTWYNKPNKCLSVKSNSVFIIIIATFRPYIKKDIH